MKIIAFYLPQFHETEDNNKWWGNGYTDWCAAKQAKPLFKNHNQPRVPLNDNYYDLSDESAKVWKWQASLANKYGIYGFCIYHYWFAGKKELEKPAEILLKHPEIDIHYSFCWDSSSWRRTWYNSTKESEVLIEQRYGDENIWKQHFEDLLPYFKDDRYIKIENKPVFHIYKTNLIECMDRMKAYWDRLAIQNGFSGVYFISGDLEDRNYERQGIDAYYNYEPVHTFHSRYKSVIVQASVIRAGIIKRMNKLFGTSFFPDKRSAKKMYHLIETNSEKIAKKVYLGTFVDYDDTPRRQMKGTVYTDNRIEYFINNLKKQIEKSQCLGNEYLYINAWNEWGEGAYLEPDSKNRYLVLEKISEIVGIRNDE